MSGKLHLGCGKTILPGWINVDCVNNPGVDLVFDLEKCDTIPLPLAEDSIDSIYASHLLEHIARPLPLLQELYRVAKPGARATFLLPYGSSDDAFEDPTHVRQYFLYSFGYFSQPYYWRADYGYYGDWKAEKITLKLSAHKYIGKTSEEIMTDIMTLRNVVSEIIVEMVAVKPAREAKKELQILPFIQYEFN